MDGVISLTFDDGLRSTFEHVAPLLARYSMPATVGVICNSILWKRAPDAMPLEDVKTLAASGWEIASHSLFHRRMEKLPPAYDDERMTGWRSHGAGVFVADCRWEDVGTVIEDSAYLPRHPTFESMQIAGSGFVHDPAGGVIYVRPHIATNLDGRLKFGSLERELHESRIVLEALGFDVQSFVVPFSLWRDEWTSIGRRYYSFVLSVLPRVNLPGRRLLLRRIPTRAKTSVDEQIGTIKEHIGQGGWPILCLHDIRPEPLHPLDWPVSNFSRLLQWIADSGLTVCTIADGARRVGITPSGRRTK